MDEASLSIQGLHEVEDQIRSGIADTLPKFQEVQGAGDPDRRVPQGKKSVLHQGRLGEDVCCIRGVGHMVVDQGKMHGPI